MTSQTDESLIDSIVAGVLDRLRGHSAPPTTDADLASRGRKPAGHVETHPNSGPVNIPERVITEAVLESSLNGSKAVRFTPKAILTPSARDYLRVNGIEWTYATRSAGEKKSPGTATWAALVVRMTPSVERVVADLLPGARQELLGCPDDAAKLATAEIARGGFSKAVIFAEQAHRAACLANRHEAVKAVAVRDVTDVAAIRRQLRANVWCLDPTELGYFELRNVLKALQRD